MPKLRTIKEGTKAEGRHLLKRAPILNLLFGKGSSLRIPRVGKAFKSCVLRFALAILLD